MKLIVIGSGSGAHLKLNSQFVSGYHAELLLLDNGEILLTDKGSKNGTYLNDQRLQPNKDIPIKRGDVVRFADQTLDWRNVPALPMPDISKIKEMRGIGTNFRNKHQLQGERVSRFHATLTKKNDKNWYIQDHSKNGTTVNGKAIPSNQDIKLKKGDKILCAGVPVPNPYGEGSSVNYRKIFMTLSIILLLCGGIYGGIYLFDKIKRGTLNGPIVNNKILTDEELFAKYKNSVVLIYGGYYYKVTAGSYTDVLQNLEKLGEFNTEWFVNEEGKILARNNNNQATNYTGTGFFVSKDGKIVTNLHVARPWTYNNEIKDEIALHCKAVLRQLGEVYSDLDILDLLDIKVEGKIAYIGMIPNGAYIDAANIQKCVELAVPEDIKKDVAILQLITKKLPDDNCNIVDLNNAVVNDSEIQGGSPMYTLGFPHGFNLQDSEVNVFVHSGKITQDCTKYSFSFDAASYGGASGSPIFNAKGQLIGVLNSGVSKSQGFNYGIKAIHVIDLLNNNISQSNN